MYKLVGWLLRLEGANSKGENTINKHGQRWEIEGYNKTDFRLKSVETDHVVYGPGRNFDVVGVFQSVKGHK